MGKLLGALLDVATSGTDETDAIEKESNAGVVAVVVYDEDDELYS